MSATNPRGHKFFSRDSNRELIYVTEAGHLYRGWLCYKHPDGQWVTLRKATDRDLRALWELHKVPMLAYQAWVNSLIAHRGLRPYRGPVLSPAEMKELEYAYFEKIPAPRFVDRIPFQTAPHSPQDRPESTIDSEADRRCP